MGIKTSVWQGFYNTTRSDLRSIYYIMYYTLIESVLTLVIPLVSSFVINSLMAHSSVSVVTLGIIIFIVFASITFLRLMQEYIVEKFEQRVFIEKGLEIAEKAYDIRDKSVKTEYPIDRLMNYFFDITTIQKILPIFIINGAGLIAQIVVSLILLMVFSPYLFLGAFFILLFYFIMIFVVGNNGIQSAIKRSDMKHSAIYALQKIPQTTDSREVTMQKIDKNMEDYVDSRQNHFKVVFRQLALSFIIQGVMLTGFFMFGGYLVINNHIPVGEFVASEIIVVSMIYALNYFIKQIDYIYDGIEGYYKVGKLSDSLESKEII